MQPGPATSSAVLAVFAVLAVLVASATGCSALASDTDDGVVRVAAAFYPLEYVAGRVAGDRAEVVGLTRPGAEPHDVELSIADTAEVARADLVVLERGVAPAVDAAAEQADGEILDAARVLDLRTDEDGEPDPHFWQDPLLMADLGDAVAGALGEADPASAAAYDAAAADLRADLEALDAQYAGGLADCARRTVVVSHEAFGYLERYGLRLEPVAGLSPGAEPTPADLARLLELIRAEGLTTVFTERLASPRLGESLARDAGVETAVLDPLEGLSDDASGADYLSLMRDNLAALREANRCR